MSMWQFCNRSFYIFSYSSGLAKEWNRIILGSICFSSYYFITLELLPDFSEMIDLIFSAYEGLICLFLVMKRLNCLYGYSFTISSLQESCNAQSSRWRCGSFLTSWGPYLRKVYFSWWCSWPSFSWLRIQKIRLSHFQKQGWNIVQELNQLDIWSYSSWISERHNLIGPRPSYPSCWLIWTTFKAPVTLSLTCGYSLYNCEFHRVKWGWR